MPKLQENALAAYPITFRRNQDKPMTRTTTNLGGTASNVVVGKVAHGLMMMTHVSRPIPLACLTGVPFRWTPDPVPDEQCFEAIKSGIDALPPGAKMFLNGGEFYGHNMATTNLEMIARFLEKYPEYVDRTFLSIKAMLIVSSPENLTRSVNLVNEKLRGTKRLDLYQCARVDPNTPVEVSIAALAKLKSEGKLDHIGMSECGAETLRRGHKVHPISVVEIEVSPFSYEPQTRDGVLGCFALPCDYSHTIVLVIAAAKELGVAVAAYSPLGRGFLTGQIKRPEDIPEGDIRRHLPRFQDDNLRHNFAIVDTLTELAKKKDITPGQLSIAWVGSLGPHVIPLPGSSHAKRTLENCAGGDVVFTETELQEINDVIEKADVKGSRYPEQHAKYLWA
ncbi:NADP-dependent oxidoreductase domain-containing protein [Boletus reticuloceps]|uniref:NADP-dependent oxidoreductase domain-containing protein n=1 Tax=Boletus reticuloceps TaxID=495285 RepID=A0A8I2YVZ2_9AGAM|nr:NADP-dependent oxidoreductase domain-containing protein [Boletus reticuloceps]